MENYLECGKMQTLSSNSPWIPQHLIHFLSVYRCPPHLPLFLSYFSVRQITKARLNTLLQQHLREPEFSFLVFSAPLCRILQFPLWTSSVMVYEVVTSGDDFKGCWNCSCVVWALPNPTVAFPFPSASAKNGVFGQTRCWMKDRRKSLDIVSAGLVLPCFTFTVSLLDLIH